MPERGTQTIAIPDNATGSRFFDRLPKEIRSEIYQLAYAPDRTGVVKINTLSGVVGNEWDRRDPRAWGQPNPAGPFMSADQLMKPFIPQLLVNKQFYQEALEEYFRKLVLDRSFLSVSKKESQAIWQNLNTLNIESTRAALVGQPRSRDYDAWTGNYIESALSQGLTDFQRLETLQLDVSEDIFRCFHDHIPCLHKYTDQDFDRISDLKVLSKVSSLKTVVLVPMTSQLAKTQPEHDTVAENFAELQKYIDKQIESKVKDSDEENESDSGWDRLHVSGIVDDDDHGNSDNNVWGRLKSRHSSAAMSHRPSVRPLSRLRAPSVVWETQASELANETQPCDIPWRPWLSQLLEKHRMLVLCIAAAFTLALLLCLLVFVVLLALLVVKMAV
ncbi:hypothetical protein HII31_07558 [Pseudocercospora fuligena]|uniref:Uncharacterized protein n=1 Tax=Pseudocercospora fuligena TaxID=685502 RepID=A0A8H6RH63_9PEZI|nr:hypothetical protein HII31_07558 [Pseudocercospora fuligena]